MLDSFLNLFRGKELDERSCAGATGEAFKKNTSTEFPEKSIKFYADVTYGNLKDDSDFKRELSYVNDPKIFNTSEYSFSNLRFLFENTLYIRPESMSDKNDAVRIFAKTLKNFGVDDSKIEILKSLYSEQLAIEEEEARARAAEELRKSTEGAQTQETTKSNVIESLEGSTDSKEDMYELQTKMTFDKLKNDSSFISELSKFNRDNLMKDDVYSFKNLKDMFNATLDPNLGLSSKEDKIEVFSRTLEQFKNLKDSTLDMLKSFYAQQLD